jgi:hypothetical protein
MTRRLILLIPVLLIAGIVVQVVALILILVIWIPCIIWPPLLNRPYQRITRGMVRLATRSMLGNGRRAAKAETNA